MKILSMIHGMAINTGKVILNPVVTFIRATLTVLLLLTAWPPLLLERAVHHLNKWVDKTGDDWIVE